MNFDFFFSGVILTEEMKITLYAKLSNETMQLNDFTNLGDYTFEHKKKQLGDHGLILLFQPFLGSQTQPLAAFLSKYATPGNVLAELIIEAIKLVESIGFFVDAMISDGASWNRSMWHQ